jgi:integrase
LMAQKWADIDVTRGYLRVSKAKARTPARRLVPLSPAAVRWLALCPREDELIGKSWASDHVRARLKAADIECPDNAFRHSFISYRCAAVGSVDRTAQEAGNSPKIIFQHYRELVTPEDGATWFAVEPG